MTYYRILYSTFVELNYLFYVCRSNSKNVERAIIKNRGRTHEYFVAAAKSVP